MKSHPANRFLSSVRLLSVICIGCAASLQSRAADVFKADNAIDLNVTGAPPTGSWVAGVVPVSTDVAVWDSTVTSANSTVLGGNLSWSGIRLANPGGLVTLGGASTLSLGTAGLDMSAATQDLVLNSAVALGGTQSWNVNTGRAITVGGVVSGTGALTKSGDGKLTLNGVNTRTGAITVNAGSVTVGPTSFLYSATAYTDTANKVVINSGATVTFSGWGYAVPGGSGALDDHNVDRVVNGGTIAFNGTGIAAVSATAGRSDWIIGTLGATFDSQAADGTYWGWGVHASQFNTGYDDLNLQGTLTLTGSKNGDMQKTLIGNGGLTKNGSGTWVIGYSKNIAGHGNTYAGDTTINNGTLQVRANGLGAALPSGNLKGNVIINSPGILDLNTRSTAVNGLAGTGTVTSSAPGALILTAGASDPSIFGGVIQDGSGTVAFTKSGTGSLTLGGTNSYTGATTVNSGSLNLTGSLATGSTVTVNATSISSYATLGGSGTVNGAANVSQYAHLSPSLATGTAATPLNVSGNLTLAAGSAIDTVFTAGGAANDLIHGSGTNTLALPASGVVTVNLMNSAGGLTNGTYTLFNNFSALSGGSPATAFAVGSTPLIGKKYSFSATGGAVSLTIANAGSSTWNGNGGNSLWSTPASWAAGSAPTNGDVLTFSGTNRTTSTNDLAAGTSFVGINFSNTAGSFTLNGNGAALTGDIVNASSNGQTLNLPLALTGARNVDTGSLPMTLGGDLSGAGSLTKQGDGILTLGGNNSAYAGDLIVAAGGIFAGNANATPGTSLTLADFTTLDMNGFSLNTGSLAGTGTVTSSAAGGNLVLTVGSAADTAFSGLIEKGSADSVSIVKLGNGILTLSADNTYTGSTTINAGALRLNSPYAAEFSNVTVNAANGLQFGPGSALYQIAGLAGSGNITLTNSNAANVTLSVRADNSSTTYSGVLSGGGSLNKAGDGTLTLGGANTFTGGVIVSGGTVEVTASGTLFTSGIYNTNVVTVNNGAKLRLAGWNYNSAGSFGALDSAYSKVVLNSATIQYTGAANAAGSAGRAFTVSFGGAILQAEGSGLWTIGSGGNTLYNQIPTSGELTLDGSQNGDFKSYITGSGSVVKTGTGTWTFGANFTTGESNTYSGDTTIQNGTLMLRSGFAASAIPSGSGKGNVIINSPGILDLNTRTTTVNGLSGTGTLTSSSAGAVALVIGANDQTGTFAGVIQDGAGTVSLTKTGAGSLSLTGLNNYTGTTTVNNGILTIGSARLADSADVSIASAGTLDLDTAAATDTVNKLFIDGVQQASGTWGGLASTATHKTERITGTGLLYVTTGSDFAAWASSKGLSGNPTADFDNDGLSDIVEYVLGTSPTAANAGGPAATVTGGNLKFTFKRDHANLTPDVSVDVEVGSNLGSWPAVYHVGADTASSTTGVEVIDNGTDDTITVTIALAPDSRKFARLRVTAAP